MIQTPTYTEIVNRLRADLAANLPGTDPTIFGSYVRALGDSLSGRVYDLVLLFEQLEKELFPQTASGEYLERWAEYEGLARKSATAASGLVTFVGSVGLEVPQGTQFRSSNSYLYENVSPFEISANSQGITTLTRSGTTATATVASDHHLATGMEVTIAGADQPEYNGTFTIVVLDSTSFTYEITGTPATGTGTITVSHDSAYIDVESVDVGLDTNLDSGSILNLVTPIGGESVVGYVQIAGLSGGTNSETDVALLERILQSRANPVANFNVASLEKLVLSVPGVTRVLVKRITPGVGDVTILFMRDNDTNPIPDVGEVQAVKDVVYPIVPAHSSTDDVHILAPTPVVVNFSFFEIDPDTPTMRQAIANSLQAFFEDEVEIEQSIVEDRYNAAIIDTVDPETGNELVAFTLTAPTGDIVIDENEIALLGTITYA